MTTNRLYLIRGLPGSGKSTFGESLRAAGLVDEVFAADDWMVNAHGSYDFNPDRLKECHRKCLDATENALMDGKSVAVCNTFVRMWEMKPYLDMCYPTIVLRCENQFESVHNVPKEKIDKMKAAFEPFGG